MAFCARFSLVLAIIFMELVILPMFLIAFNLVWTIHNVYKVKLST